ncbi:MAG: sensor histidine kinase [Burkholderiales bacterium]
MKIVEPQSLSHKKANQKAIAMSDIRLNKFSQLFVTRFWRVYFVLMLLLLHFSAMRGAEDFWARALMLAHFGFFILWQPFMRGEQQLSLTQTLAILGVSVGILLFLNWWLLGLWVSVLAGIVGGKVFLFQAPWLRRFYLVVLAYLVALLLVWIVPNTLLAARLPAELGTFAEFGLPLLFLAMLLIPAEADSAETLQVVDFFYATLLFLLLVVLVLGSFAFMSLGKFAYGEALSVSLLVIAAVLLSLSLAWNPRAGFGGLSMYFSRYLLSIGLPFEQWLFFLAELSRVETRPEQLMKEASSGLSRLPWVAGGVWRIGEQNGEFGSVTKHTAEYDNNELHLTVYSKHPLSPSLIWHFHLLGQLLGEFYSGKVREQKLQQQTYVQAVHETGARVTHDVKNLLQSLNVLCSAVQSNTHATPEEVVGLLGRQLPVITQRLQQTLDKLQKPQTDHGRMEASGVWWEGFKKNYKDRGVEFSAGRINESTFVPKDLFDGAGDNLLQNALRKRTLGEKVSIRVSFRCNETIELSIEDSGEPVPADIVHGLMKGPVNSSSGFGIGLFQTARLAENAGYSLKLVKNEVGAVGFLLRRTSEK